MSYLLKPTNPAETAKYVLQSSHTSTSGTEEQIPLSDFTAISTMTGVTITSDNLVISRAGTYIVTSRLFSRDNVTTGSSADISINVRDGGASPLPILENSRYNVGKPSSSYCRISHEFTMIFKVDSGSTKTLYYSTSSSIGAVVLYGDALGEYTSIEVMRVD